MSYDAVTQCCKYSENIADLARSLQIGNNWPLIAPEPQSDLLNALRSLRENFCSTLAKCDREEIESVLRSGVFLHPEAASQTGIIFQQTESSKTRVSAAREIFGNGWNHPMALHAFAIAVLEAQPWEMPIIEDLSGCSELVMQRYLEWLFIRPVFRSIGHDAGYVEWLAQMLEWLSGQLKRAALRSHLGSLINTIIKHLDIGAVVFSDVSIRPVLDARAKLLTALTSLAESLRGSASELPRRPDNRKRVRIGVLLRTIMKHPDPIAFCSQFEHLNKDKYEFIVYSQDILDRQTEHDIDLYQRLFGFVSSIRTLVGLNVREMIDRIRSDNLDIFVYSHAATIGASPADLLAHSRLAQLQVVMNSYLPLSTGFSSFTHMITVQPHADMRESLRSECHETVVEAPGVLISYLPFSPKPPVRKINRSLLNIPNDATVLYNGGAADKIVPLLLDTWIRALKRIPDSYLLLAPFNPGWGGVKMATNLHGLIVNTCQQHRVDPRRVVTLRELSPHDTHQLYELATVYLGTFPHGSSTSVALAMQACVPAVTRRSPWLRGTGDASIVQSIGLDELVAADADEYVDLTVRLATDLSFRNSVIEKIELGLPDAPFLSSQRYGESLQSVFDSLVSEAFGSTQM